jgi:hypothetical protein
VQAGVLNSEATFAFIFGDIGGKRMILVPFIANQPPQLFQVLGITIDDPAPLWNSVRPPADQLRCERT